MNCKYHNNLKGTNTCCVCGDWICDDCVLEIDGRVYCKDCLKNKLKNEKQTQFNSENTVNKSYEHKTYSKPKVFKSSFLTFILSACLPGAGHMYLGYTKRGLTILVLFMLGFYIDIFSPLILITWVFNLFDVFKLKSNIENGIYQEDSLSDIKNFLSNNKFFVAILCLIIFVPFIFEIFEDFFDFIFGFSNFFRYNYHFNINGYHIRLDFEDIIEFSISIIVAVVVILFIAKLFKKRNKPKDDNNNYTDNK